VRLQAFFDSRQRALAAQEIKRIVDRGADGRPGHCDAERLSDLAERETLSFTSGLNEPLD
jgi:hypothetical protein